MRLAFLGTGAFGAPALRALAASAHAVQVVISQPDRPSGRGLSVRPTPIREVAEQLGLRHEQAADINAAECDAWFEDVDLAVVVAFGQKIGARLLRRVPRGFVNIHASLLPRHRGAAPFQWAIIKGDAVTGVTLFQLDEQWDAGPIWARTETSIGPAETATELHDRLAELGAGVLLDGLNRISSGDAAPFDQDVAQATRAPKLTKADGVVDFDRPAFEVVRRINGLWSWPTVSVRYSPTEGQPIRVQLARAEVADASASPQVPPGTFLDERHVQCGTGVLALLEVRPAGKRLMSIADFARGRGPLRGARLLAVDG